MRLSRTTTAPTASLGHVERVATSWAIRMKYSSHEGRARFSSACSSEVFTSALSKGSVQPVSRVAEARHDERTLVEFGVDGGGVEPHVGVLPGEALDTGHGGDGVEAGDPGRAFVFQLRQGRREAPPRREHRGEGAVEHPEASAQDRDQAYWTRDLLHLRLGERGPDLGRTGGHVAGSFGDHDQGELLHGLPELRGGRPFVAQDGELVPAQRAIYDVEVLRLRFRLTHTAGRRRSGR